MPARDSAPEADEVEGFDVFTYGQLLRNSYKTYEVIDMLWKEWNGQVESLQNFTKTLAKQNDLEILEDRIQKAHGV